MIHTNRLAETVSKLQTSELTVSEYLAELESRSAAVEPTIEAFVPEPDRWGRLSNAAAELHASYPDARPPLYGVPVGVKDIIHVEELETKAGSSLPPEELTGPEAVVVQRLKDAGALVLGKTVTTEFAHWEPGPTRNPHDPDHTPGGSSSGSAAAVAAGVCPLALGSQTIGSVIRPASFCGVVGVKPSYGRIPTDGVIPFSTSVDHVGFFTQDVAGAEIAASVLCQNWRTLPEPANRPKLGVPNGAYLEQATSAGIQSFRTHCDRLQKAGYDLTHIDVFPDITEINKRHERLIAADAAMAHHEWYQAYGDRYADQTAELINDGYATSASDIAVGRASRFETRDAITACMDEHEIDMWIAPAACGPAPEGIDSTGDPIMNLPWTHSGLPTISLPTREQIDGLPLGVQCSTRFGTDETLLAWASELAAAV